MGWFDKKEEDNHSYGIFSSLMGSKPKKKDNYNYGIFNSFVKPERKKNNDKMKRANMLGLFEEEKDEIKNNNYEPEDFEDDEVEDGDYYSDEY